MSSQQTQVKATLDRMLLPTLLLCTFTALAVTVAFSTLLVDIAASFEVSIGTASQLGLISSLIGILVGAAMSSLSLRFRHKTLFLAAILLFTLGAVGYFLATDFVFLILAQFMVATGLSIMSILSYTLIGEHLPIEKRGWAIGLVISSGLLSFIIIAPLSGFITGLAGWRMVFLWFIIPLSVICLALSLLSIPSKQPKIERAGQSLYKEALKKVFLCKSAVACLTGSLLLMFIVTVPTYAVSYYRDVHSVSPAVGGILISITGIGGIVGGLSTGKLCNRFSRKKLAGFFIGISGIACIIFTFIPIIGVSVAIWTVAAAASTAGMASLNSLTLEQVPKFRGPMMSINGSFQNVGSGLGVIVGGFILNSFSNNFNLLMVVLGALGACATVVLLLFASDPLHEENVGVPCR